MLIHGHPTGAPFYSIFQIPVLCGIWIFAITFQFLYQAKVTSLTPLIIASGFLIVFLRALRQGKANFNFSSLFFIIALNFILYANLTMSRPVEDDLVVPILLSCFMIGGAILAYYDFTSPLVVALRTLSVFLLLYIMYVALFDSQQIAMAEANANQRLTMGVHPNLIGLVACAFSVVSLSYEKVYKSFIAVAIALFICSLASSRSSMITIAFSVVCYFLMFYGIRLTRKRMVICILIALPIIFFGGYFHNVVSHALLLDDEYRGLNSGFSGRDELWRAAIAIWLDNPIMGIGYRQHQRFMPDHFYAHNMVLVILSDLGLIGLAVFLWMFAFGVYKIFRGGVVGNKEGALSLTVLSSYWVYGIFEGRALNVANVYSIVYFITLFYAINDGVLKGRLARDSVLQGAGWEVGEVGFPDHIDHGDARVEAVGPGPESTLLRVRPRPEHHPWP